MNQERIAALIEKLSEKFDANREHQDAQIEKLRQEQKEALLRLEEANKDRFNRVDRDLSEVKARVEKSDGDLASIRNELTGRNEGILERFATIETRLSNAEQSAKTNAETQASLRVAIERASDKIDALKEKTAHESGASGRDAKILWAVIVAIVAGVVSLFFNMSRNTFTVPASKGKTTPSIQREQPKNADNREGKTNMQRFTKPAIILDLDQTMITILTQPHPPTAEAQPLEWGSWIVKRPYLRRALVSLSRFFDLYVLSAGSQGWVDQALASFQIGDLFQGAFSVDSIRDLRLSASWVLVDDLPFEHPNTQNKLRILGDISPKRLIVVPAFNGNPSDRMFQELESFFLTTKHLFRAA